MTTFCNATHACPVMRFTARKGRPGDPLEVRWVEPVIFAGRKEIEGRLTWWYVNAIDGEAFFDYFPLPVWGKGGVE